MTPQRKILRCNWGRICATAACLFIDNLSPPPPRYTPGPNPIAPIHRPFDEMYDTEEEYVGGRHWGRISPAACLVIDNLSHLHVTRLGQTQSRLSTDHLTRCMTPQRKILVVAIGEGFVLQQLVCSSMA